MKLSKRILSCFLSFSLVVTMMCGLFTVQASADIMITDADVQNMIQTAKSAEGKKIAELCSDYSMASATDNYTNNTCGCFAYGHCVNHSSIGNKVRCTSIGYAHAGVVDLLKKNVGTMYINCGSSNAGMNSYYQEYFSSRSGNRGNVIINTSYSPEEGDIVIFHWPKPEGNYNPSHVGIMISSNTYIDGGGDKAKKSYFSTYFTNQGIYAYQGVVGYFKFKTNTPIDTGLAVPVIHLDKTAYNVGDTVNFTWDASTDHNKLSHYWVNIRRLEDGVTIFNDGRDKNTTYFSFVANAAGTYVITTSATPKGSVAGEGSETDTVTLIIPTVTTFSNISASPSVSSTEYCCNVAFSTTFSSYAEKVGILLCRTGQDFYDSGYSFNNNNGIWNATISGFDFGTDYYYQFYGIVNGNTIYSDINVVHTNESQILDLGTNFYSAITNRLSNKVLTNDDPNVSLRTWNELPNQVWKFERQYDGSYKIINCKDGYVLEDENGGQDNGSNVVVAPDNGSDEQRWYIKGAGDNCYFISKCIDKAIDVSGACTDDGTNIQMWYSSGHLAQKFIIKALSDYSVSYPTEFEIDVNGVLIKYNGTGGAVDVPYGITSIGQNAFMDCSNITSISLPNTLKTIGCGAFYQCTGLTRISIPSSVEEIFASAFYGCTSLKKIYFSNGLKCIGMDAFRDCSSLTEITLPDTVSSVASGAFYDCKRLESVFLPENLDNIPASMFYNCINLSTIEIPKNIITVQNDAFLNCNTLNKVLYSGTKSQWENMVVGGNNNSLLNANIYCTDGVIQNCLCVTATPGDALVILKWNAVPDADKYAAYIVNADGTLKALATKLTGTTYTAKKLTNGTTYKFLVRAYVDNSWSKYTDKDIVAATPISTRPEIIEATAGDSEVALTWTTVDGAEKYAVYCVDAAGSTKCLSSRLTTASYTAKKLTNGKAYKFYVRAYVNGTWSKFTAANMVQRTPVCLRPSVKAEAGDAQVTLTWSAINGAEKYAAYTVGSDGTLKALSTRLETTEYTAKKLTNGTKYKFLVRAYVNGKWTPYDSTNMVTCTPVSSKPVVKATAGNGQVTLNWGKVTGASKYAVYVVNSDNTLKCLTSKLTANTYTVKNLVNGKTYKYVVRAYVNGAWSKYTTADYVSATPKA